MGGMCIPTDGHCRPYLQARAWRSGPSRERDGLLPGDPGCTQPYTIRTFQLLLRRPKSLSPLGTPRFGERVTASSRPVLRNPDGRTQPYATRTPLSLEVGLG